MKRFAAAAAVAALAAVVRGRRRPLPPEVGRPGAPAVRAGARRLGRPVLWPQPDPDQAQPPAYSTESDRDARPPSRVGEPMAWIAVALALVGVALLAFAFVTASGWLAAAGGGGLVVAAVLAVRFRIMEQATVSQSVGDRGGS